MENLKCEFFAFLDERKNKTMSEAAALAKDDRKDESNVLKAKANIYDIFKAIWGAAEKLSKDQDSFKTAFLGKSSDIPAAWEKSLEVAKQHNDTFKIVIEEAKLAAVEEIKLKFDQLF